MKEKGVYYLNNSRQPGNTANRRHLTSFEPASCSDNKHTIADDERTSLHHWHNRYIGCAVYIFSYYRKLYCGATLTSHRH
jgi:hypothetical protein